MNTIVNFNNTQGIGSVDLSGMDIETALLAVQGQRAGLLEGQLKNQLEDVQRRNDEMTQLNEQINAKRSELAALESGAAMPEADPQIAESNAAAAAAEAEATAAAQAARKAAATAAAAASDATSTTKAATAAQDTANTATAAATAAASAASAAKDAAAQAAAKATPPAKLAELQQIKAELDQALANKGWFSSKVQVSQETLDRANAQGLSSALKPDKDGNLRSSDVKQLIFQAEKEIREINRATQKAAPAADAAAKAAKVADAKATDTAAKAAAANAAAANAASIASAANNAVPAAQAAATAAAAIAAAAKTAAATAKTAAADIAVKAPPSDRSALIASLKADIENMKTGVDSLSSSQQMQMLHLQSLSNKRNEAFDLMTNFIKKMQESRSSIIGNMR